MSSLDGRIAGAPITWGVCEVPGWGYQLSPERVLAEMARIGLPATELGPDGFLPDDPALLRELLARHGLRLVGGFLPILLHEEAGLDERLAAAGAYADLLSGAGAECVVLAASAAGNGYDHRPDLDRDQWATLVGSIDRVIEVAAERGLTVALHPHYGTVVERAAEVERILESSPVKLCLDTGHLLVGGADPLSVATSAPDRVAHVHMKDVAASVAERVREGDLGYQEAVAAGLYRPLGQGDLDVPGIVRTLEESGYCGWYVLEQDTVVEAAPEEGAGPLRNARASVEFLDRVAAELDQEGPASEAGTARTAREAASPEREESG